MSYNVTTQMSYYVRIYAKRLRASGGGVWKVTPNLLEKEDATRHPFRITLFSKPKCKETAKYFPWAKIGIKSGSVIRTENETKYWTWTYGQPDYHCIFGWALVLAPNVGTYVEWHYIDYFSANKCQNFEWTGRTLCSVLVPSNALKGFPSVPYWRG